MIINGHMDFQLKSIHAEVNVRHELVFRGEPSSPFSQAIFLTVFITIGAFVKDLRMPSNPKDCLANVNSNIRLSFKLDKLETRLAGADTGVKLPMDPKVPWYRPRQLSMP